MSGHPLLVISPRDPCDGNEARGLSDDVAAHIDAWARLPVAGKAESLNVAVAGGVLMYAWLRESYPMTSV